MKNIFISIIVFVVSSFAAATEKYVVFMNGVPEYPWPNIMSNEFYAMERTFKAQGWNVARYTYANLSDIKHVLSGSRVVAVFWSSHATPTEILSYEGYRVAPESIRRNNSMRLFYMCGCHSKYIPGWSTPFPRAEVWGQSGLVYPNDCAYQIKTQFMTAFNRIFSSQ